ncbi:glycosyltransferase [Candidatus Amarolinea dominans]|uniref:glycosyltransferase n=1 Tax=Candidatus Amarolinea dominans TaxID=3140696 RepID=UPI001DA794B3|nr:glycosyltransferase [Anaerolineae bacterium]
MTHILMLVTSDLLHDNRVRREAETLAAAGCRVTVVSAIRPADIPALGWEASAGLTAVAAAPPAWQAATGWRRAAGHAADLWRWGGGGSLLAAAADQRSDVVHAHDLDTLPAAATLAQRWRAPLVYDAHELFVDQMTRGPGAASIPWPNRVKQTLAQRNFARLERRLIGRAAAVITVSQSIATELATRYGIATPTLVLNTPRYQDMTAGSSYLRQRLGLAAEQRIILLQGAVLPDRHLLELVQAMPLLPPAVVLVFLGFNLGTYQEAVRQEVARLGLQARVFMLDALPAGQLLAATASADVGMILLAGHNKNDRFAMPNKLFEYMMAGLPFVATDWPEIGRVARTTGAGVTVAQLTPAALAAAVNDILQAPARQAAMRTAGLAAARGEYNWERQAQRLLELYAALPTARS